jgi:hypothetical protein
MPNDLNPKDADTSETGTCQNRHHIDGGHNWKKKKKKKRKMLA